MSKKPIRGTIVHWCRYLFSVSYRFEVEYDALMARRLADCEPPEPFTVDHPSLAEYSPGKRAMLVRVHNGGERGPCHVARRNGVPVRVYPGDPEFDPSRAESLPPRRQYR
jgi:hypothetical protein